MHPYQVSTFQIANRSIVSERTCSGVEVGAIGVHYAHTLGDNGFLRLTNVRIPRTQMLMQLDQVESQFQNNASFGFVFQG